MKKKISSYIFLVSLVTLYFGVGEGQETLPDTDGSQDEVVEQELYIDELKGIVLYANSPDGSLDLDHFQGIDFVGLDVPGNSDELKALLTGLFICKPLTEVTILEIQSTILDYYKDHFHPLVVVTVPEQKISSGILMLVVIESTVGEIRFAGNCSFSSRLLKKYSHLQSGDRINSNELTQDLLWMNRNPFRETMALLSPGHEQNTTDIEFLTKDRTPYRVIIGDDNTGIKTTGTNRLFTGIDLGNFLSLDQILSYQYIVSTEFGRFYAHTIDYRVPLPWRHLFDLFGGYSGIRAAMPIDGMHSHGRSWQGSMRYIIPLPPKRAVTHEFRWGIDYKSTDVNLLYNSSPILGQQAVITQLMVQYNHSFESSIVNNSFQLALFVSPGDIFHGQSKSDYQSLRLFATSSYTYFRGSMTPVFHLPSKFEGLLNIGFQWANRNLLSSEQFGLGGYDTVRGYDQRTLNTDNAFLISGELRSPIFHPITRWWKRDWNEVLQFLAFLDYGFGTNHHPVPKSQNFFYLMGVGVGMRYRLRSNIISRLDWGYPIHHKIANNLQTSSSKIHYSFILAF